MVYNGRSTGILGCEKQGLSWNLGAGVHPRDLTTMSTTSLAGTFAYEQRTPNIAPPQTVPAVYAASTPPAGAACSA